MTSFTSFSHLNVDESKILVFSFILQYKNCWPSYCTFQVPLVSSIGQGAQELNTLALQSDLGLNPGFATV